MTEKRADRLAMIAICLAAVAVTWPLLSNLHGVPPDSDDLDIDGLTYYGYAGAARTTVLRYHQFPWRSPWHGGGYPLYAYPDDLTLTPTMLLVLALGPWAAIKIDFVITMMVGGVGMFLLTRRKMGYSLAAALFSATAFAYGGFLMARWLRGWRVPTHAVWLPLIMYALWRGRRRRWSLAFAAALVAWLLIDQKYVTMVMGWFLLMVGLLRLDEEDSSTVQPAWGYHGRLVGVWLFGLGLAAVKLVPMAPLLAAHLRHPNVAGTAPTAGDTAMAVGLWLVIFAALGLTPWLARLVRLRATRLRGAAGIVLVLAVVVLAAGFLAPRPEKQPRADLRLEETWDGLVSFGRWDLDERGHAMPIHRGAYTVCSPVGAVVCILAVAAVLLRPRTTWKWAILACLLLVLEVSDVLPRHVRQSWHRLPTLSWIHRPREQLNFYLFFVLTLLAGRAIDWRGPLAGKRLPQIAAWVLLAVNVVYTGVETHTRIAYTASTALPNPPIWGGYQLLEEPFHGWYHQPCFLVRGNYGLKKWNLDFRDGRENALVSSHADAAEPIPTRKVEFEEAMVSFDDPQSEVRLTTFTPNRIEVTVHAKRPGVLTINQIHDLNWTVNGGVLERDADRLAVRLTTPGVHSVRLIYFPRRFLYGVWVSVSVAVCGLLLLAYLSRRSRGRGPRRRASTNLDAEGLHTLESPDNG